MPESVIRTPAEHKISQIWWRRACWHGDEVLCTGTTDRTVVRRDRGVLLGWRSLSRTRPWHRAASTFVTRHPLRWEAAMVSGDYGRRRSDRKMVRGSVGEVADSGSISDKVGFMSAWV
ncbi:hypothetical protein M6B38_254305 [Iris pallida]|uniref:Uncharacterized protein n=1 Tax=Iris pallida TaxID=29817 RepID=A0AAX6IHR7_IRIPA|nr:hypothetical protein M6B38_254305 [Iris pallida]